MSIFSRRNKSSKEHLRKSEKHIVSPQPQTQSSSSSVSSSGHTVRRSSLPNNALPTGLEGSRTPLAPLGAFPAAMEASTSSPLKEGSHEDENERSPPGIKILLGRQIVGPSREDDLAVNGSRKRSISGQSTTARTSQRHPLPSSSSLSGSQQPSNPTIRPAAESSVAEPTTERQQPYYTAYLDSDDLYAGLNSYSFGVSSSSTATTTLSPTALAHPTPQPSLYDPALHHEDVPRGRADTASVHTFGGAAIASSSRGSSVSRTPSLHFTDEELDDDEYVYNSQTEYNEGEGHREHNDAWLQSERRDSLPMDIVPPANRDREREGSLTTLRRPSRSLDDDLRQFHTSRAATEVVPRSEPSIRGDWIAREQPAQDDVDFDMDYILGDMNRRPSTAQSIAQAAPPRGSSNFMAFRRRLSNATTGTMEDTFAKHINKYDEQYGQRKQDWSFQREKADGTGNSVVAGRDRSNKKKAAASAVGTTSISQDLWRCVYVGRFKVNFTHLITAEKEQRRLNIDNIPDPFSKGNKAGGPAIIVHKHSQAAAFSILRTWKPRRRPERPPLRIHNAIMLARRKVQVQFTSTSTTSKLMDHGLLNDRRAQSRSRRPPSAGRNERDEGTKRSMWQYDKPKNSSKGKETASGSTVDDEIASSSANTFPMANLSSPPVPPPAFTPSPSAPLPSTSMSRQQSDPDHSARASIDTESSGTVVPPSFRSHSRPPRRRRRDSLDLDLSDEDRPPTRTPHREAFSSLDAEHFSQYQGRHRPTSPPQKLSWITSRRRNNQVPDGPPVPWLRTAPRSVQEESDRQVSGVGDSFQAVGLLPTPSETKKNKASSSKHKAAPKHSRNDSDVFSKVPEESLYMLLPMWLGEPDPQSVDGDDVYEAPRIDGDRRYLLVYYVPFDKEAPKGDEARDTDKKKSKHSTSSGASHSIPSEDQNIVLTTFRICSQLVSYDDLTGTGVRLPDIGLSIVGPTAAAEKAMRAVPSRLSRPRRQDEFVIGICHGRDKGIEFIPEGLTKLGLCVPMGLLDVPLDNEFEEQVLLSPIGLAVVEMAWAGCMALTSFAR